jgi:hypothetical protein
MYERRRHGNSGDASTDDELAGFLRDHAGLGPHDTIVSSLFEGGPAGESARDSRRRLLDLGKRSKRQALSRQNRSDRLFMADAQEVGCAELIDVDHVRFARARGVFLYVADLNAALRSSSHTIRVAVRAESGYFAGIPADARHGVR